MIKTTSHFIPQFVSTMQDRESFLKVKATKIRAQKEFPCSATEMMFKVICLLKSVAVGNDNYEADDDDGDTGDDDDHVQKG